MKTCARCKKPYPDEIFIGPRGGAAKRCAYCREKLRENDRRYREANREKMLEISRQYYEENREKIRERKRQHYEENREKVLERQSQYNEESRKRQANADMEALFPGMLASQVMGQDTKKEEAK